MARHRQEAKKHQEEETKKREVAENKKREEEAKVRQNSKNVQNSISNLSKCHARMYPKEFFGPKTHAVNTLSWLNIMLCI